MVILTRPLLQAKKLAEKLNQSHQEIVLCPLLEINPTQDLDVLQVDFLGQLTKNDLLIFTSPNAVIYAKKYYQYLANTRCVPMGEGTAQEMLNNGLECEWIPTGKLSGINLLATFVERKMVFQKVGIFTGAPVQYFLSEQLTNMGVQVENLVVYQRSVKSLSEKKCGILLSSSQDCIVVTSLVALNHLIETAFLVNSIALKEKNWIVSSEKLAKRLQEIGCVKIQVAENASDAALIKEILK